MTLLTPPSSSSSEAAWADQLIQDVLQENHAAFIRAYNAALEQRAKEQFEHLCNMTYHLLGLRDAEDVDYDDNLRSWQYELQAAAAERYRANPELLDDN